MKGGIFILHEQLLSEVTQLNQKISDIKNKLNTLPEGKLICAKNNPGYKWYQSNGHTKIYIPKKNRHLAEQLAIKKYLSLLLKDLENELLCAKFYLKHHSPMPKAEQLLTSPEYQSLLAPYFTPKSLELKQWQNASYEQNPLHPEQCIHKSISGNLLRSKSEAMIDMFLHLNRIPFRYECALPLGETTLYPDFTICHPSTRQIFYWEHFGLMDSLSYAQNTYTKLQLYTSHNIIPTIGLITTYETKEHPLNSKVIENIIEQYFL